MSVTREWRADPDAETILRDIAKVPYVVGTIGLGEVDWSESSNNCARLTDPLNAEKIEDYASSMNRGDVFPRIVVERGKKKGRYIVLGGNQRSAALKSIDAAAEIDCYIVDPLTSDERELIIRSLNSRHGWGSTKEDRIEHAVFLVRKHGMHIETVARAMVVSDKSIYQRIKAEDERSRLAKAGLDASRMPLKSLASLAMVADESLRTQAAKAVIETKVSGDKAAELASVIAKAKSRAAAVASIADFKKAADLANEVQKTNGGRLKKPRRERFLRLLNQFSDFLERGNDGSSFATLDELNCSVDHDLDNVRMLAAKVTNRLNCICEAGK
jgi:hypothetical protein